MEAVRVRTGAMRQATKRGARDERRVMAGGRRVGWQSASYQLEEKEKGLDKKRRSVADRGLHRFSFLSLSLTCGSHKLT